MPIKEQPIPSLAHFIVPWCGLDASIAEKNPKKPPKALGKRHEEGENKHDLPVQDAGSAFSLHAVKLFAKGNNFTPLPSWNYSVSADSPSGAQLQISKYI